MEMQDHPGRAVPATRDLGGRVRTAVAVSAVTTIVAVLLAIVASVVGSDGMDSCTYACNAKFAGVLWCFLLMLMAAVVSFAFWMRATSVHLVPRVLVGLGCVAAVGMVLSAVG